ncbi:MAG: hypothetical protein JWN70_4050 [Planctomycetaceae bacterium]|nr:hypothetical protein [Planctomycetaceae bacterium]
MDETSITEYITGTLGRVDTVDANGDRFFFYDPGDGLPPDHMWPFATLVTSDFNDTASNLNRPGVYRLNIGVSKQTFGSLFGSESNPADVGDESGYDFTVLDQLMPHPVYGKMYWVCVLNPGTATFESVQRLLAEAYGMAVARHTKKG